MAVADLMDTHSRDALALRPHEGKWWEQPHGADTTMRAVYDRKAARMTGDGGGYSKLDEPIRSGTIDPVLLGDTSRGETEIVEGHHRIARAHQLGVERLPVSRDPNSQVHYLDWDDPEEM
jgi:hypothetical protein